MIGGGMSDWSSPRQRRKNGLMVCVGMILVSWMLFHVPSRMASFESVFTVACVVLATGVMAILPLLYDWPYIRLGDTAVESARQLVGFSAEQTESNAPKAAKLKGNASLTVTHVVTSESEYWLIAFIEPGRSLGDCFVVYEDGRVLWQEASSETLMQDSAWRHAGLVRLRWLKLMLKRYGSNVELMPRRPY